MSGIIGGAGSRSGVIGQTEIDYETGTWTPVFSTSGGGGYEITTVIVKATYVKIGKSVTIFYNGTATYDSNSGAAAFRCSGVPFTPTDQFTLPGTICGNVSIAGEYSPPSGSAGTSMNTSSMIQTGAGSSFPDNSSGPLVARTIFGWSTYIVD